ncbi:hypothetical protein MBLNU457_3631t1 [Dothideomycetes sp. NU457]
MALFSSPPLPAQDIVSPPPSPMQLETRKRHFPDYDSQSSDPIFSEDASESDSYTGPRRKRLFKGPWWLDSASKSQHMAKAGKSGKIVDSGVWIASESSIDMTSQADQFAYDAHAAPGSSPPRHEPEFVALPRRESPKLSKAMDMAARIVERCIDLGDENVDLSRMDLPALSSDSMRSLQHLTRAHNMDRMADITYLRLTPDLKILAGNNFLEDLPSELWDLENITVLSLRSNFLKGISERVGELYRLQELNIALNQIETLPFELLHLLQLREGPTLRLYAGSNPFLKPVKPALLAGQPELSLKSVLHVGGEVQRLRYLLSQPASSSMHVWYNMLLRTAQEWLRCKAQNSNAPIGPIFAATTDVTYYDMDGAHIRSQHGLAHTASAGGFTALAGSPSEPNGLCSYAPSLFELAVRSCRASPWLGLTTASELFTYVPPRVEQGIQVALESKGRPLHTCSVCRQGYVIKRAEWIEYWYCNTSDTRVEADQAFLPFERKACSFGCVKQLFQEREMRERQDTGDLEMTDV